MTQVVAMLGIARPYKRRKGRMHDVGGGRRLTVSQIAYEVGCRPTTIHGRIAAGESGSVLMRPLRRKLFDCGGEMLTVSQIMRRTGLSDGAVRSRISRGLKGAELLRRERKDAAAPRSSTMVLALRIADAFPDRLPTTKEIRKLYPMTPQTAERWLASVKAARERR